MKLSRTVAYAIQATLQLAQENSGAPVPCSRLAAEGEMPERFLLQILRSLVTHGVLRSTRGVDGGYALNRPAEEISMLEIIEAVDGPISSGMPTAERLAEDTRQVLENALGEVRSNTRRVLGSVMLAQLLPAPRTA